MKIRSTINGGIAEVSEEFGALLIEAGGWVSAVAAPAPAAVRKPRGRKAPVEEPKVEE